MIMQLNMIMHLNISYALFDNRQVCNLIYNNHISLRKIIDTAQGQKLLFMKIFFGSSKKDYLQMRDNNDEL